MVITIVSTIILLGVLIFAHELGHFYVAKKVGIGVKEFAIGFGPSLLSRRRGETIYSLRAFPLGGFVRMMGEDPDEAANEDSFQSHAVWKRFLTIVAGPMMNFVLAVLLLFLINFALFGVVDNDSTVIGHLTPDAPAQEAGLQSGDRIITISGEKVERWVDVVSLINQHPEQEIVIELEREGNIHFVRVTPMLDEQTGVGLIGIGPHVEKFSLLLSLRRGITQSVAIVVTLVMGIAGMISGQTPADVVGPVGLVQIVGEVAQTGIVNLMYLAAVISVNLGILNLLPIPALDGSRLLFLLVEGVRGKPVDPEREAFIHFIGFTALIFLMLVVAYRDFARLDFFL